MQELGIDPDHMPEPEYIEGAVLRLRRSYSTTRPEELCRRIDDLLRQVQRSLLGEVRAPWRRSLREASAWLLLLRGTVLADARQFEPARASVRIARELAREIGHREVEAWTWETDAWMAATGGRQSHARELAGLGIAVAPVRGHALVAATLQRARINGALVDERAAVRDLLAGERAMAIAADVIWPDDHYSIDPAKAAFFASGTLAALHRPAETIEHAAEVVRRNQDPHTRDYWPMRVANARLEWAMALVDQGEEDEALGRARQALDREWFRPDTERRARMLVGRMRDARLRGQLAEELGHSRG